MAPWTGRLRHGEFAFEGRQFNMPITLGEHAIHGTVWNQPWRQVHDHVLEVSLGEHWPVPGWARQEFALADDYLRLRLSVHTLEQPFPASIGWHPWFRRRLDRGEEARLSFAAESIYGVDEEQIPTGKVHSPPPGPWDDCFKDLMHSPRISWPGCVALQLESTFDHWVVYDQPAHALCVEPMSGPPNALNMSPVIVTVQKPLEGEFILRWTRML
jgi:galactose mutarotase-like enzyme